MLLVFGNYESMTFLIFTKELRLKGKLLTLNQDKQVCTESHTWNSSHWSDKIVETFGDFDILLEVIFGHET